MSRRVAHMEERDNLENLEIDGAIMKTDLQDIGW